MMGLHVFFDEATPAIIKYEYKQLERIIFNCGNFYYEYELLKK
jgi:hypothetical protein